MAFPNSFLKRLKNNDSTLTQIAHRFFPSLTDNDIAQFVEAAKDNTHLKQIIFSDIILSDKGGELLSSLTQLEKISFPESKLTKKAIAAIEKMPNLKSFAYDQVDDEDDELKSNNDDRGLSL